MNKKLIAIILICIMLIGVACIVIFHKTIFARITTITYPDGCVEKFRNDVAITKLCTNGRILKERQEQEVRDEQYSYVFNNTIK